MKINDIILFLESIAPPQLQENYDNSGLLIGHKDKVINQALITLDCTEEVVDEAIENDCDLIIAHHPIVFSGIKRFDESNYIHRTLIKAIKHDIAIYDIHTNLDNVLNGVNGAIASKLGLVNTKILRPKKNTLKKVCVFVPEQEASTVRESMWHAGAGQLGNYSQCSFNSPGLGTFLGNENSQPAYGKKNQLHFENEVRVEMVFPPHLEHNIISSMIDAHPYEEVSYDVYSLDNRHSEMGSGLIGHLEKPMDSTLFLSHLKSTMNTACIRHTKLVKKSISKVAICGGSGSFLLHDAIAQKADVFISADFKYHQFFDANDKLIIADIGHYESEQFTKDLIYGFLNKKFTKFATHLSRVNTNPINYLK